MLILRVLKTKRLQQDTSGLSSVSKVRFQPLLEVLVQSGNDSEVMLHLQPLPKVGGSR